MKRWYGLVMVAWVAACGSDGGGATDTAGGADTTAIEDTGGAPDTGLTTPDGAASDTGAPGDTGSATDTAVVADVATGTKPVGEGCAADAECASGICLSSPFGDACTAPCAGEADCDGFPIGMFCLPVRPGKSGCVPETGTVPPSCDSHGDCAYPLYCRFDAVGCDLPECLHDGDCSGGQLCEPATRRCKPALCHDDVDCRHPGLVCHDDQTCGAPLCTTDAECGAAPSFCHPVQRQCSTAIVCEKREDCFYNEACTEAGLCLPDLCWNPCQGGKVCDPKSGWCGQACSGPGVSGCATGEACLSAAGVCAPNTAPVAWAVVVATGTPVAEVTVGAAVALSGAGSIDPEGEALSLRWTLLAAPAGSARTAGSAVGGAVEASFTPDVRGRFVIGLYARDPAGVDSIEAAVTLIAR